MFSVWKIYLFYTLWNSLTKAQELEIGSPFPAAPIPLDRIPPNPFPLDAIPAESFPFFPDPPPRIQPSHPIDCFPPPPGPNGVFNIDVNSSIIPVKITVKYECHPGFSATDPTQFSCQNGKWDIELDIPNCTIPETGFDFGNSNASSISRCEPGNQWSLQTHDENFPTYFPVCSIPPSPPDGAILLSSEEIFNRDTFSLGTEVIYSCEDTFSKHVQNKFTCTSSRWLGGFPSCLLHCDNPPSTINANIFPISTREFSQARFFCDPGVFTSNATLIYCIGGEWKSAPEGCGNPPLLINGAYEAESEHNQEHYIHENITYFCISEYYLNAPTGTKSTCLTGNRWSLNESTSNFPICEPNCGYPPQATNATIRVFSTIEGSVAHYNCDEGLSTTDVTTSTCRRNGNVVLWDLVQLPLCTIPENGCGNPPMINNGYAVRLPPDNEGDIVKYDCIQGYELVASSGSYVVCRQNEWINESKCPIFPFCRPVCLSLPTLPRGGVVLVDETLRNKDGISFSNGVEHGYGCQPGYRLVRDATLTCVEGDWYWRVNRKPAKPQLCYRDCGPPPEVANATVNALATVETWAVDYICNPGLSSSLSKTIVCDSNGKWVSWSQEAESFPTCTLPSLGSCGDPPILKNDCSAPPPVPNAQIRRTLNSESQSYEYMCDPGFSTNDITITNCLDEGTWSLTRLPRCAAPKQEGASITYQCKDDFRMVAPNGAVSTCQAGNKWSLELNPSNFPECRLVGCKTSPSTPDNGVLILNEPVPDNNAFYAKGSAFIYGCDNSGGLIGTPVSICLGKGWFPDILQLRCVYGLDVPKTNDFIRPNFSISSNMTNDTVTSRTNGSDLIPITSVCGYPGFCVGSPPDIYFKCSNQTLFECEACGVGRAASFLFFFYFLL
ncbi:unnamed protein product [Clavelina lepadiformis]|uniref:Sushi domain-containing protein n=1 Tax=Clavelina lepadiformis TaxID=159417 RepID=A0ABP0G4B9_CLALP